jgi:hypothetical protein
METWASWALFLAIIGAGYLYYSQSQAAVTRGRSTATRPTTASSAADTAQWLETEVKAKAGKAAKVAKAKAPRKSVKTAVQEVGNKVDAYLDTASSTAGADADDDLSPVASPAFTGKAPSGRDVSDMLGSQSAAPSVLSIKPAEKPTRVTKPQAPKAETPQESKKARQNRRKVEEAKAAREAEEKQRQTLLENQRRTAREARGEPARNGLQSAKAPASNAWTTVGSAGAVQPPASSAPTGQFLDTFDAASTASSSEAPTNGTAPTPDSVSNSGHNNNALSEEEQVKMALEDTSAWETVAKGKKQKKKTVGVEEEGEVSTPQVAQPVKPVHIDKFVRPTVSENKKPSSRYQILQEEFTAGADNADDWPVV